MCAATTTANGNKVYENVIYKGEPGSLTLTNKFFHYQANIVDAAVKCSWSKVDKRQLSPPGSDKPMLKLLLLSGRTAVFEFENTRTLIAVTKDVKNHMEKPENKPKQQGGAIVIPEQAPRGQPPAPPALEPRRSSALIVPASPEEEEEEEASTTPNNNNNNNKAKKTKRSSVKPVGGSAANEEEEEDENDEDEENPSTANSTNSDSNNNNNNSSRPGPKRKSKPPSLSPRNEDPYLRDHRDRRDDSKATICYCCWDSIYCWICMAATVLIVIGIALLVYFFAIKDKGGSHDKPDPNDPSSRCVDPFSPQCPPDDGSEDRYGIRAVEYVWTPELVRLEYYISDYILDASVDYVVWDGIECRDSTEDYELPRENEWMFMDLVDGAPNDGGANLYNEGKGTRQFDIVLSPRRGSLFDEAPFYTENGADFGMSAFLRVCVTFSVYYNRVQDYNETIEVNYIENAIQMRISNRVDDPGVIQDVQIKTVTRPQYKV